MAAGEELGHDPEWNDGDLPEVDVEIPDDISELDREVQAYHRELRQRRRQRLFARLMPGYRRLGPFGVLGPVVAIALLATAVFGSMTSLLGPRAADDANGTSGAPDGQLAREEGAGRPLPNTEVVVDGAHQRLPDLRSAVVLAVPEHCQCAASVDAVTSTAQQTDVDVYLSGEHDEIRALAKREGNYPHVVDEASRALADRYQPAGLSAVLVDGEGNVADVVRRLDEGAQLPKSRLNSLLPGP